MSTAGTSTSVPGGGATSGTVPIPLGTTLKLAAADPKTTNVLLLVVVLCMSGFMPEQFTTICGV